mmetsp:Transcript_27532/g.69398  ORF Transcript_27532/g.69398 Transcript_27532/m.69398 type:complete len:303 (-) Transcript_27532:364-1272(-)
MRGVAVEPSHTARTWRRLGSLRSPGSPWRGHFLTGNSQLNLDLLLVQLLHDSAQKDVVHRSHITEGDEAKASGTQAVRVEHNHSIVHLTIPLKILTKRLLVDRWGQPPDEYLLHLRRVARRAVIVHSGHVLAWHRLFSLHLPAVDGMLKGYNPVCDAWGCEYHETKAAWATCVLVVADERLQDFAVVFEVLPQLGVRSLPTQTPDKHFIGAAGLLRLLLVHWRLNFSRNGVRMVMTLCRGEGPIECQALHTRGKPIDAGVSCPGRHSADGARLRCLKGQALHLRLRDSNSLTVLLLRLKFLT